MGRIAEPTSFWTREFQIMDQQNHQAVKKIIAPSDRNWTIAAGFSVNPS